MFLAWSMTSFTSDSRSQSIEVQFQSINGTGGVTTKTLARFRTANRAAQRILERRRHSGLMTNREIQATNFLEKAHTRLVKRVVVAKEVRLADVALTKTVKDGSGDALRPVRNGVVNRLAL